MDLREQLLLECGGGVRYEGAKAQPTDEPILFIGLGGTGADALLRIKNEVQQRMPLPKDDAGRIVGTSPRNIAFLEIDTDQTSKTKSYGVASFNSDGSELLMLSTPALPHIVGWTMESSHDSPVWNWFDPSIQVAGGLAGASGIRQVGRFMLFHNIQNVVNTLRSVLQRLNQNATRQNLQVFILTGIAGGTGSGIFLDVAYLIRLLATQMHWFQSVQIHGYFITPDVNAANGGLPTVLYRNGFAALKELDYWMRVAEHNDRFHQEYPGNFRMSSDAAPFDFCHIITACDQAGNLMCYSEVLDSVADILLSCIMSDPMTGRTASPAICNEILNCEFRMQKPYPVNYHMESAGFSKLEIPYTEIMTLLAARVFGQLSPMFCREPDKAQFDMALNTMQLTPDILWHDMHCFIPPLPITGQNFGYNDIWQENWPYKLCHDYLADAQVKMRRTGVNLPAMKERIFVDVMEQYMRDKNLGPCFAARLLNSHGSHSLIPTMEGFIRDCRAREASCASRSAQYRIRMEQAYTTGSNIAFVNPIGRSRAVDTYMEALTNWINNEFALWAYRELADALVRFLERLVEYDNRIFQPLLSSLTLLPDIFQRNQERLTAEQNNVNRVHSSRLIDPIAIERQNQQAIDRKTVEAADAFPSSLFDDLKRWIGLTLSEVDADITETPDIPGAISDFMTEAFADPLNFSVEDLLRRQVPLASGWQPGAYYEDVLQRLLEKTVPMFREALPLPGRNDNRVFLLLIPTGCLDLRSAARNLFLPRNVTVQESSETRSLRVVLFAAGTPLCSFAETKRMKDCYDSAMSGSPSFIKGLHLRPEWRDLPSPIPEIPG